MIAETTADAAQDVAHAPTRTEAQAAHPLSLRRIAATLQLLLATRRAARSEDHAYWYTVARGM